jgi:hypothetical protein
MKKTKKDNDTCFCSGCCKDKHESICSWVHRLDENGVSMYRYIRCNDCVEIEKPLIYDPVVVIKEKVKLQCKECKSKKTIVVKETYTEYDFYCKKCKTENSMIFI